MSITVGSFLLFTGLVALITWIKTRHDQTQTSDGYFLAGRSLTGPVIAGSLMLTNLSTEQLVGLNGVSFKEGFVCMAWETLASVALVLLAIVFLPRYLRGGLTTIPQFLEDRYDKTTRTMTNLLFLSGYLVILLPTILYSGAVAISGIFDVPGLFGVDYVTSIWLSVWGIGLIGSAYAIFGGLRTVAVSDSLNGIGLLIGGLLIPVFGLAAIGGGDMFVGFATLLQEQPAMFNAIGEDHQSVPFSTLFTGMMLVNTFYWCTNQAIVQRTLGAKNLAEGQKGVLLAAGLKLLGPLILVLPGMIAFHLFGGTLTNGDQAYPRLVQEVLPPWLTGFFGAVLVGAILSSFNSALNSAATLFSKGLYKAYINQGADERRQVQAGKGFGIVIALLAMMGAPLIMKAPQGLFGYLQEVNGCYSIPILTILVVGMFHRRMPAIAAKVGLVFGVLMYINTQFILKVELHFLHVMAILFVLNGLLMMAIAALKPRPQAWAPRVTNDVDLSGWNLVRPVSVAICALAIGNYMLLAPISKLWLMVPGLFVVGAVLSMMTPKPEAAVQPH